MGREQRASAEVAGLLLNNVTCTFWLLCHTVNNQLQVIIQLSVHKASIGYGKKHFINSRKYP